MDVEHTPKVVWEDPPPPKGRSFDYFWNEIDRHPGRWARWPGTAKSPMQYRQITHPGQYEQTQRSIEGRIQFWVRRVAVNEES